MLQKLQGFDLRSISETRAKSIDLCLPMILVTLSTDVRDGLTHRERIVLQCLYNLQQERGGRNVPTGMLYGTVVEYVDMSVEEMQSILVRLIGHPLSS